MTSQTFQIGDRVRILRNGEGEDDPGFWGVERDDQTLPLTLFLSDQGHTFEPGMEATITSFSEDSAYGPLFEVTFDLYDQYDNIVTKLVRANQIELVETGDTAVPPTVKAAEVVEAFAEWEKELLDLSDKRPDLNKGDIIRITGWTAEFAAAAEHPEVGKYLGLEAEVLDPAEPMFGVPWVRPLTERPDGHGFSEFGTLGFTVELVTAAADRQDAEPETRHGLTVGDTVVIVGNQDAEVFGGTFHFFDLGQEAEVTGFDGDRYIELIGPRPDRPDELMRQSVLPHHVEKVSSEGQPEEFRLTGAHVFDRAGIAALPEGTVVTLAEDPRSPAVITDGRALRINSFNVADVYDIADYLEGYGPLVVVYVPTEV